MLPSGGFPVATSRKFENAVNQAFTELDQETLRGLGETINAVLKFRRKYGCNPDVMVQDGPEPGSADATLVYGPIKGRRAKK